MTQLTGKDLEVVARTLWAEARGEGFEGMVAAGWTIRNRVFDGKSKSWWGEGWSGVCQKPWQFSCWNKNDPNYAYMVGTKKIPDREYALAEKAAIAVSVGTDDPTLGATHYYSTTMKSPPAWAKAGKQTVKIGRHIFFTDVK